MDFGTLLHMAKKNNESGKTETKCYSTKFAPPKKESKDKKLSDNIKKFLQKREQEEKERQRQEREKLASLLSMRDEKSKNKIKKMLKVTKSANKSVLDDAINTEHTAVTMEGPEQPDQDDYGYVSNEANAFYQKYIEKVKDVKEDKGFSLSRPQSVKDISGTKERVKAAITREIEEKKSHTRNRITTAPATATVKDASGVTSRSAISKNLYDPEAERQEEDRKRREEEKKKTKNRKPMPPPMDFQALLKLAEKKQHEPVEIVFEEKKEPERLLTSKEKRELEERQREREARERRRRERNGEINTERGKTETRTERNKCNFSNSTKRMEPSDHNPKFKDVKKAENVGSSTKVSSTTPSNAFNNTSGGLKKSSTPNSTQTTKISSNSGNPKVPKSSAVSASVKKNMSSAPLKSCTSSALSSSKCASTAFGSSKNVPGGTSREFPPRDTKTKSRQFPLPDSQKTRQFPPTDVRKESANKANVNRKPPSSQKRRILDDDDDDEYDSELDDFIDDGDYEEDYSSHIKEIFGYDRSRYRDINDEDDAAMESNFAQVQREEYISKKIGIQEDLEDMKMEAAEKKRKMIKKRKLLD